MDNKYMKLNSLLPFNSKQIKLLETNCICCKCPLSTENNGFAITCIELLNIKQPCNCQDIREQALQVSKKNLNTKKEILGQEEFRLIILKRTKEFIESAPVRQMLINSHAAALERITELKSGMKRKNTEWRKYEQWYNDELESRDATIDECTKRIVELEKQLEDAKELSEKEKAIKNTFDDVLFWIKNTSPGQISAPIIHNSNDGYFQCTLNGKKHYYTKIDTQEEAKMKLNEKINDFVNRQIDFEVQYKEGEIFIAAQDWPDNQIKPESFIFKYEIK